MAQPAMALAAMAMLLAWGASSAAAQTPECAEAAARWAALRTDATAAELRAFVEVTPETCRFERAAARAMLQEREPAASSAAPPPVVAPTFTIALPPPPAAPAPAPSPYVSYPTPPEAFAPPTSFGLMSVRAAQGNLALARDAERRRLGADAALADVGGYFAVFSTLPFSSGVAHGVWSDPRSPEGAPSAVRAAFVRPRSVCGVSLTETEGAWSQMTYLGPVWRPEWAALDAELAGPDEALARAGGLIPDGVRLEYLKGPEPSAFARHYPSRALDRGVSGEAGLHCIVENDGKLSCLVDSEDPAGWRFGDAAVRLASEWRVAAKLSDGTPSAQRCASMRISFKLG